MAVAGILVTGNNGFLGKYVCDKLTMLGYDWTGFDMADGHDITNLDALAPALQHCNICIHLAAEADLYNAFDNPQNCQKVNVTGTQNISALCKQYDVRLIYASTACLYGNNGEAISDEQSPAVPTEIYATTKLHGEQAIEASGCDYHILRIATFYGIGMRQSLAIHRFCEHHLRGKPIQIHGDGTQTRAYTHVEDIADAICIVLKHPETAPRYLNIAHPASHSVNQLIAMIETITGKTSMVEHVADRHGQIYNSMIDSSKMQQLGWQPKWALVQGLAIYINSVKANQ